MQKLIDFLWSVFNKPEDPVITKFKELLVKYPANEWKTLKQNYTLYIHRHPDTKIELYEYVWHHKLLINNASNGIDVDEKLCDIYIENEKFHRTRIQKEKDIKILNEFLKMEI